MHIDICACVVCGFQEGNRFVLDSKLRGDLLSGCAVVSNLDAAYEVYSDVCSQVDLHLNEGAFNILVIR